MRIPALGPRGEGWAIAQLALAVVIVVAGIAGPRWSATTASLRLVAGIAFGVAGWALLVLGILKRSRFIALLGLGAVAADVTVAELGGFKAMNETRSAPV